MLPSEFVFIYFLSVSYRIQIDVATCGAKDGAHAARAVPVVLLA